MPFVGRRTKLHGTALCVLALTASAGCGSQRSVTVDWPSLGQYCREHPLRFDLGQVDRLERRSS